MMEESFCAGMRASHYRHLRRIYELEMISDEEKNKYVSDLKKNNLEIYFEVIDLKNRLEKDIVNVRQVFLFGREPVLNIDYQ